MPNEARLYVPAHNTNLIAAAGVFPGVFNLGQIVLKLPNTIVNSLLTDTEKESLLQEIMKSTDDIITEFIDQRIRACIDERNQKFGADVLETLSSITTD